MKSEIGEEDLEPSVELAPVPEVPDLELPSLPEVEENVVVARAEHPRDEPATVPQPVVRRTRREPLTSQTPLLGTRLATLDKTPWQSTEPAPEATLELTDADLTDPVPTAEAPNAVEELEQEEPAEDVEEREQAVEAASPPAQEPVPAEAALPPVQELAPVPAGAALPPAQESAPVPAEAALSPAEESAPVPAEAALSPAEESAPVPAEAAPLRAYSPPESLTFNPPDVGPALLEEAVFEALSDDPPIALEIDMTPPPETPRFELGQFEPPLSPTGSDSLAVVDQRWDDLHPLPIELDHDLPEINVNSLERLADLPPRPRKGHAPSRYAPRKSDVSDLVSGFAVGEGKTDREVCRDLKLLAGIDATSPPPAVSFSETPPPVAVTMDDDDAREGSSDSSSPGSARAVAGAAVVALVIAGVGFGSIPVHETARASKAVAAAAPPKIRVGESSKEAPCTAEINVSGLPARARVELRAGPDATRVEPDRVIGSEAVFSELPCREPVEVMLELSGHHWLRVPVAASELTPSDAEPSLVRHTVAVR